jgi:hypothetical protein
MPKLFTVGRLQVFFLNPEGCSLLFCVAHIGWYQQMSMYVYTDLWSNSVVIVSDYRLDDRGSIPGRGKGLFL